jgi:putative aldouronate transport system substrate-binding protein
MIEEAYCMRKIIVFMVVIALVLSFAGCNKDSGTEGEKQATTTKSENATEKGTEAQTTTVEEDPFKERVKISVLHTGLRDPEDGVIAWLGEKFNAELDMVEAPYAELNNMVNLKIASGETPDIFQLVGGDGRRMITQLAQDGVTLNISKYLDNYPNLKGYYEKRSDIKVLFGVDEDHYVFPMHFGSYAHGIVIRADWLEELGLEMPDTWEDFRNVLKEFVDKNPGGKVTSGLTVASTQFLGNILTSFAGTANSYVEIDGELHPRGDLISYRKGIKYIGDLYKEGLLIKELGTLKDDDSYAKFINGQVGAAFFSCNSTQWAKITEPLLEVNPDADPQMLLPFPKSEEGRYWDRGDGYTILEFLNGDLAEDDAKRKRIFSIFDYVNTEEGIELGLYGLEGVHHKVVDGKKVFLDNEDVKRDRIGNKFSSLIFAGNYGTRIFLEPQPVIDNCMAVDEYGILNYWVEKIPAELNDKVSGLRANTNEISTRWTMQFYLGEKDPLSDDWDEYEKEMNKAGAEELRDIVKEHGFFMDKDK